MSKTLSPATIRFRLWQLRTLDPEVLQPDAASWIGCSVDALRAAVPTGWTRGGNNDARGPQPAAVATDSFMLNPEHWLGFRKFRSDFTVINGSLM